MGWDAYIFVVGQIAAQVEVFQVQGHKACFGGADDAVKEAFGSLNVSGLGGDIAGVFNFVAASGPADVLGIRLLGTISTDDTDVFGFLCFGMSALWMKKSVLVPSGMYEVGPSP